MSKWKVRKCGSCSEPCGTWIAIGPWGHGTYWASWQRAMLRATKGY